MVSIGPYSDILKERKRKFWQSTLHAFLKKREEPQPGTSSEKWNFCIMSQSKGSTQGSYCGT